MLCDIVASTLLNPEQERVNWLAGNLDKVINALEGAENNLDLKKFWTRVDEELQSLRALEADDPNIVVQ